MTDGNGTLADALADLAELPDLAGLVTDHPAVTHQGTEVRDLPDDLALTDDDIGRPLFRAAPLSLTAALDVAAGIVGTVRAAGASDYHRLTWLADVLRAEGLSVVEHPGWKRRGRPRSVGPFTPRGVLWHHDGSARGPSPELARFLAIIGRPAEGIPAPLSQLWVCMGCRGRHPVGTWHVLAAGRANHGGIGSGWGKIGADAANSATLGVETDNTTAEPTPPAMFASLCVGTAAIMRRFRSDPRQWLAGHKEYARGRKIDPDDIDMNKGRRLVVRIMYDQAHKRPDGPGTRPRGGAQHRPEPEPYPGRSHFQVGKLCDHGYVAQLGRLLVRAGFARYGDGNGYQPGPRFTEYDRRNVAAFQRSQPALRDEPDGYPGPVTWRLLQEAARRRPQGGP